MNILAIIPARGGSKRIPKKNIRDFLGKPILAYSIEAAKAAGIFSEIMVSTDDDQIARVAQKYGARIPFMRSKNNAGDFASLSDVILEVLEKYKEQDEAFDYFCCILPTAPLITSEIILEAWDMLQTKKFSGVLPVCRYSYPIQRAFTIDKDETLQMIKPENIEKRSQELSPTYHDSGQFYFCETSAFLKEKSLLNSHMGTIVLSKLLIQDVDDEVDWKLAEMKYQIIHAND